MKPGLTIYKGVDGDWRWRLVASNGRIIAASSEGYRRRRAARDNLAAIRRALR